MNDALRALRPLWIPGGILAAAALAVWLGRPLPTSLSGLRTAGPYATLAAALALAWSFNRGRSFVIAASFLGAFAASQLFPQKAVYTLLVVLVPLNALAVLVRPERGARYSAAHGWLALLVAEGLLLAWVGSASRAWALEHWWLRSPPVPFVGRIAFAAALAAAIWRAWPDFRPVPVADAAALVFFFLAAQWVGSAGAQAVFFAGAGVALVAALLQESHQLAFRDALTGLPGRRALEERLRSLGERYAVAMVDVDHFKRFNDTHGHDIGDQVLKLVGGRLAQVGAGGVAYRYGGEEFCVLFPDADATSAERAMEEIRAAIERYQMAARSSERPKKAEEGAKHRGEGAPQQLLSVTVSIGIAAPSKARRTAQAVVKAADEALYRAKQAGRNRVSQFNRGQSEVIGRGEE